MEFPRILNELKGWLSRNRIVDRLYPTSVREISVLKLFEPFRLKEIELKNRIAVAPMCQYSCEDGYVNDWHLVHLGSRAVGGAGLVVVEATAVSAEGRISPSCSGIYHDGHVDAFARINRFIKQFGAVPGIQLAHAGRKGSAQRPWEGDSHIPDHAGGWPTIAPSAIAHGGNLDKVPMEMSIDDIHRIQDAFVTGAKRALAAGFEWLELHFAHGYLAHEFYSPISNHRHDRFGGSFENRTRFLRETLQRVRSVWPERFPLTARLSVTDWVDGGVTIEESIELINHFRTDGLDLVDISHGFVIPDISPIPWGPGFMVPISHRIREATGMPTAVGWFITDPHQAEQVIANGEADLVMLARELLRDPYWPYHAAVALKASEPQSMLPPQYARAVS